MLVCVCVCACVSALVCGLVCVRVYAGEECVRVCVRTVGMLSRRLVMSYVCVCVCVCVYHCDVSSAGTVTRGGQTAVGASVAGENKDIYQHIYYHGCTGEHSYGAIVAGLASHARACARASHARASARAETPAGVFL